MSRQLIVLRHAKAERGAYTDHDRPLTARGRVDALAAGRWLAEHGLHPDLTVCSTAVRAKETWALAAAELGDGVRTIFERAVYGGEEDELLQVLREVAEDARRVVLCGHNPGLQYLVLALAGSGSEENLLRARQNFGTAAVAVLHLPGKWAKLAEGSAELTAMTVARG
ncbi:MAG TPA: histidine phosphatase family protein [Sporichthyaceae bacterium]|jgi:phosphohistidine phosphatase